MRTMPRRPTTDRGSGWAMLAMLVLSIPASILKAWVVQHLWAWFVLPTFGVAVPSIAVLYGLTWIIGLMWPMPQTDNEPLNGRAVTVYLFTSVGMSLFGLLIGAIAHGFV